MVDFSCSLKGRGWLEVKLSEAGQTEIGVTASYLTDAAKDFLTVLSVSCENNYENTVLWIEEPGSYVWSFKRQDVQVEIKVYHANEYQTTFQREKYSLIFDGTESLKIFGHFVLREFEQIKTHYTVKGYQKEWGHEFPTEQLDRLKKNLKDIYST